VLIHSQELRGLRTTVLELMSGILDGRQVPALFRAGDTGRPAWRGHGPD
jgi:hypothetical protein